LPAFPPTRTIAELEETAAWSKSGARRYIRG
jgi:hypothetical protein